MKRTCVWCKAELPTENADSAHVITRSFCANCREYFSAPRDPMSLEQYLNQIGVPVLVTDDDVRVMGFNEPASALLGCSQDWLGRYGGDVLECAYARLPGGCGNTEHCKACAIRRTITATYATGDSKENVPAYQDIVTPVGTREVRYLISTEKVGSFVLLRIDEVRPGP
jgi:PAS domain-containing protein